MIEIHYQRSKLDTSSSSIMVLIHKKTSWARPASWKETKMTRVGFEPTPMKTTALTLRLRPLGHRVSLLQFLDLYQNLMC